jgi:hypothetical protein
MGEKSKIEENCLLRKEDVEILHKVLCSYIQKKKESLSHQQVNEYEIHHVQFLNQYLPVSFEKLHFNNYGKISINEKNLDTRSKRKFPR